MFECPSSSCKAFRLSTRRQIWTAFVRRNECVPNLDEASLIPDSAA